MLELILKHDFSALLPLKDISELNADSVNKNVIHWSSDQNATGGFCHFNGSNSRISVPYSNVWHNLTYLRIDTEIWIDSHGRRHNLVEGLLSFSLYVRASGVLSATIFGLIDDDSFSANLGILPADSPSPGGGMSGNNSLVSNLFGVDPDDSDSDVGGPPIPAGKKLGWVGVNSDVHHSPDGVRHLVPVGQWVSVIFVRDAQGFQLFLDGNLVGTRSDSETLVRSVQGAPIAIGAWPNSDTYNLAGRVRNIEIWKYDHRFRFNSFICGIKDTDEKAMVHALHAKLVRRIRNEDSGKEVRQLMACLNAAEQDFLKAIRNNSEDNRQSAVAGFRRYHEIWCGAGPDSAEMKDFLGGFAKWVILNFGEEFIEYQCKVLKCLGPVKKWDLCTEAANLRRGYGALFEFSKFAGQAYADAMKTYLCAAPAPAPDEVGGYDVKGVDSI